MKKTTYILIGVLALIFVGETLLFMTHGSCRRNSELNNYPDSIIISDEYQYEDLQTIVPEQEPDIVDTSDESIVDKYVINAGDKYIFHETDYDPDGCMYISPDTLVIIGTNIHVYVRP